MRLLEGPWRSMDCFSDLCFLKLKDTHLDFLFFNLIDNLGYDQLNTMIQSFIFFRLLCDKIEIPLLLE